MARAALLVLLLAFVMVTATVPPTVVADGDSTDTASTPTAQPAPSTSTTSAEGSAVLAVTVAAADGDSSFDDLDLSGVPTFQPSDDLVFAVELRNPGSEDVTHTLSHDRVFSFAVQDVFKQDLDATWTVQLADGIEPGATVTVPANGGSVRLGEASWDPAVYFEPWDSVVAYHGARASAALDGGDRTVEARTFFRVEPAGLPVDAYGSSQLFPGLADSYFSGQTVPVNLQNRADGTVSGTFDFAVRGPAGRLFGSAPRAGVTLDPGEEVSASWDQTDAHGDPLPAGTYLVRARLTLDDGTKRFDEFPVTLHRGPQVTPVPAVTTDRGVYAPGETVRFTVSLTNPNPDPFTLEFGSGQEVDVVVTRPDGTTWRWSDDRSFTQATHSRTLSPGETVTWTLEGTFDQAGAHRVVGQVTTKARLETPTPAFFHVGADGDGTGGTTCTGSETTELGISLTDADGRDRDAFFPGEPVHVHLVNTGDATFSGPASLRIFDVSAGVAVHEQALPSDRSIRPGQAWTFVWDQTGPDGRQVPDGQYAAEVATASGSVAVGLTVGDHASTDGTTDGTSSGGTISGSTFTCTYSVPGYYYALEVTTDAHVYPVNGTVTVRVRPADDLKGTVRLTILDARRQVVHDAAVRVNTTLPAGETMRLTWDQRGLDGAAVPEGFYVARVEAGGLVGEAPFFVGAFRDVPFGDAGPYDSFTARSGAFVLPWDDDALAGTTEAYGRAYFQWFLRSQEDRDRLARQARASGLHGAFDWDGRVAEGTYVSFSYDAEAGRAASYSVAPDGGAPQPLFSSVAVRPFVHVPSGTTVEGTTVVNPLVAGPAFVHAGQRAMVQAVDVPEGVLMIRSADAKQVDLVLAEGLSARVAADPGDDGERNCVEVTGRLTGRVCVLGGGEVRVAANVISVELAAGSQLLAAVLPEDLPSRERTLLAEGVADGRVGAEVSVSDADAAQPVLYAPGFERVGSRPALAEDGRRVGVEVVVDRARHEGTVLVFKVDRDLLNVTRPEDVGVLLDGEPIPRATSVTSILNPVDPDEARYVVVLAADGVVEVLVHVPHFSERTLTIQDLADLARQPAFQLALLQAFLVAAVVTLAAAVAVFRGKDEE